MKRLSTVQAITQSVLATIRSILAQGSGVIVRHNGQEYGVIAIFKGFFDQTCLDTYEGKILFVNGGGLCIADKLYIRKGLTVETNELGPIPTWDNYPTIYDELGQTGFDDIIELTPHNDNHLVANYT